MSPFDLEKAKAGAQVVTRDGRKVSRFLSFNIKSREYPIAACVISEDGEEVVYSYTDDGLYYSSCNESSRDLFMASVKHTRWVNLYSGDDPVYHKLYKTKKEAIDAVQRKDTYICTIKIEWEEEGGAK